MLYNQIGIEQYGHSNTLGEPYYVFTEVYNSIHTVYGRPPVANSHIDAGDVAGKHSVSRPTRVSWRSRLRT